MAEIVAKTKTGFLVEFSKKELNSLAGMCSWPEGQWEVGVIIKPDDMYSQLSDLVVAKGATNSAIKALRDAADKLEKIGLPNVVFNPKKAAK